MQITHHTQLDAARFHYEARRPAENHFGIRHKVQWTVTAVAFLILGVLAIWIGAVTTAPLGYLGGFVLVAAGLACGRVALDLWDASASRFSLARLAGEATPTTFPKPVLRHLTTKIVQRLEERVRRLEEKVYSE